MRVAAPCWSQIYPNDVAAGQKHFLAYRLSKKIGIPRVLSLGTGGASVQAWHAADCGRTVVIGRGFACRSGLFFRPDLGGGKPIPLLQADKRLRAARGRLQGP